MENVSDVEIMLYKKLSIIQYLLSNNWSFVSRPNEIIFDLLTNDEKISVINQIILPPNNTFVFCTHFPILKSLISYEKLLLISNCINEIFQTFNVYVREVEEEDYNLFFLKETVNIVPNMVISEEFWDSQLKKQMDNVSSITDFLYYKFVNSEYYNDINNQKFKFYLCDCFKSYISSLETLRKDNSNISLYSKEELQKELNREFDKFLTKKKDIKDVTKLNLIVNELQKFNNSK